MRLISAERIHDGRCWLPSGTIICLEDSGRIVEIGQRRGDESVEFFDGLLCPGFVNVHCHLELSHLKGAIPQGTGIVEFVLGIMKLRNNFSNEEKRAARHVAAQAMYESGVSAVGDIANSTDTHDIRAKTELAFHTFVECTGFVPASAAERFQFSKEVFEAFAAQDASGKMQGQSIVPHAPYSVSKELLTLINDYRPQALLSIHSQESAAERLFFLEKKGDFLELYQRIGINPDFFDAPGASSLHHIFPALGPSHPMILVHNTDSAAEDLEFATSMHRNLWWCLCPSANLYIENRLPDAGLFSKYPERICLGTDSLASNSDLSIAQEMSVLKQNFPELDWELLLQWACSNGAKALQMEEHFGAIREGLKPGIVQLTGTDGSSEIKSRRII